MSASSERLDSMSLLVYMAPIAAATLLPATLILEGNVLAQAAALSAKHTCACSPKYQDAKEVLAISLQPQPA